MASYKTPGVYVEEIPTLPQSVADVPTAIPGFVGYTEYATAKSDQSLRDLENIPQRISSLIEYERYFGKGPKLELDTDGNFKNQFVTYDSLRLFFDNGGGVCYIVSIGSYNDKSDDTDKFNKGLDKLKDIDEVTLLLMPDAATCLDAVGLGSVQQQALKQCRENQDRFAILDVKEDKSPNPLECFKNFREKIGTDALQYGAAYYPYISTTYNYSGFSFSSVVKKIMNDKYKNGDKYNTKEIFNALKNDVSSCLAFLRSWRPDNADKYLGELLSLLEADSKFDANSVLKTQYENGSISYDAVKDIWVNSNSNYGFEIKSSVDKKILEKETLFENKYKELKDNDDLIKYIKDNLGPTESYDNIEKIEPAEKKDKIKKEKADLFLKKKVIEDVIRVKIESDSDYLKEYLLIIHPTDSEQATKEEALKPFIPFYKEYEKSLATQASIVPPSGAIAGIYAQNDNYSGVWKAPANISIASVKGLSRLINTPTQDEMNVHPTGKSINAIRAFSGKGILVWGARTLAGNDNEWRYISVRRLFNYVEESVKKSTEWAVFEPNTQNTWTKIKSQIENFLINVWRAGGLAGATPSDAFFVNVGLGITMDQQDILEGRLIVEIGMAAVRPAEFIILRFSHKLQES